MRAFFDKLYKGSAAVFHETVKENLANSQRMFIITANPEIFMFGKENDEIRNILLDDNTTMVADGIGLVKGAQKLNIKIEERIPGVELAEKLFRFGDELQKTIFLLGATKEVIDALSEVIYQKYPLLKVVGAVNGYTPDKDAVFEEIKALSPDIVLVALGMPAQEKLIFRHLNDFEKGIFVGVGGSFDVLSGTKKRAPAFFIKHNIEWLYRIAKEPYRIKRFYKNNIKFLFKLK